MIPALKIDNIDTVPDLSDARLHSGILAMMKLAEVIREINISYETILEKKISRLYPLSVVNADTPAEPAKELQHEIK